MRRGGFTMIELIFVIVILGILAAVAIPKFVGVTTQAREANMKSFVATLNRTVAPTIWSKNMDRGGKVNGENLSDYIDIPKEFPGLKTATLTSSTCGNPSQSTLANQFSTLVNSDTNLTGKTYSIECRDGNTTTPVTFRLVRDPSGENKVLVGPGS